MALEYMREHLEDIIGLRKDFLFIFDHIFLELSIKGYNMYITNTISTKMQPDCDCKCIANLVKQMVSAAKYAQTLEHIKWQLVIDIKGRMYLSLSGCFEFQKFLLDKLDRIC